MLEHAQRLNMCVLAAGRVWKILLDPVTDTHAYTITATLLVSPASPAHTIQLRDVLFGDVWLCVGQNKLHHSVAKVSRAFFRRLGAWYKPFFNGGGGVKVKQGSFYHTNYSLK